MNNVTCIIDDCTSPRYQRHRYCGSHYMKWYRYGDPHYKHSYGFKDLTGKRFGSLVARERIGNKWRCDCDCGETCVAPVADLNRAMRVTCGIKANHHRDDIGYGTAHDRVRALKGSASNHPCLGCNSPAHHWSYDHQDPHELTSEAAHTAGLSYSLNPKHYGPRCASCHRRFDIEYDVTA